MIKSKLHNPIIAQNSHIENAVVQKVNNDNELVFSNLDSITPVVPETGRIWFNTDKGQFHFANVGNGGNGKNYVDEFLSRTDLRAQEVVSKIDFQDTLKINDKTGGNILTVDSTSKDIHITGNSLSATLSSNTTTTIGGTNTLNVTGDETETFGSKKTESVTSDSTLTIGGKYTTIVTDDVSETYSSNKSVATTKDYTTTVGGKYTSLVTGVAAETFSSSLSTTVTGNFVETVGGTVTITVAGNVTENFSSNQQTNITSNLGIKVGAVATLTDGSGNTKVEANNTNNTLTVNYATININGQTETHKLSNKFTINDGLSDKLIIDNSNDKITAIYDTIENTSNIIKSNVASIFALTDSSNNDKIIANHVNNSLNIHYAETTITGNATVDGNMLITGDLTIGGQTTKVDVASENLRIADNVIILNSNLTEATDPRLASAIVDGVDVDYNAGVAINRGSQGILDLIKWVESTDTSSNVTLRDAVAKTSVWNYEAATPAYELHQIINAYSLARKVKDKSGTHWVGYDGHEGLNYSAAKAAGATTEEALDYSFKLDADLLDNSVDAIVEELDNLKFDSKNSKRVGQTPSVGTEFTITHNLGTVYVDVRTQREDDGKWYFDILPIQVIDANTIKIVASEATKIRYMISAIEGFDVNQATELVII
jgi:hypothetical protein